uniref:NAD-dependent protein deacetylase sirtuin-3, mitochondrial isoform X1 n=1 Tax=Petromyzon marinus TaxID=7757 RepID=A0AAJ7WP82_PETMA|nr:NAD-dependent protein deacetylase sirtuin-3, mitochondrial isoform X1 [Petromyzon marinus]
MKIFAVALMSSLRQHGGVAVRQATRKLSARPTLGKAEQPNPMKKPQALPERNAAVVAAAAAAKVSAPARTEVRGGPRPAGGTAGTRSESSLSRVLGRLAITKTTQPTRSTRPFSTSSDRRDGAAGGGVGGGGKIETLEDVARLIRDGHCKNIVLMAGAGMSTASGIPDFRTPGTGLYDNLQRYHLPFPEAVFDLDFFAVDPKPFFTLAQELYPGNCRPNDAHYFARLLHERRLLLRLYTQNIDGLESLAGLPPDMLVEAHGTFASATCTQCRKPQPGDQVRRTVMSGKIPHCGACSAVVKPDIVFFGEDLPRRFYAYDQDFSMADLLIVIGTSLEVMPFAGLVSAVRPGVPRLLLNREAVGLFRRAASSPTDVAHLDDVVAGVRRLTNLVGWDAELDRLIATENKRLDKELAKEDDGPADNGKAGTKNGPGKRPSGDGAAGRRGLHTASRVAPATTAPAKPWAGVMAARANARRQNAPPRAIDAASSESDSDSSGDASSDSSSGASL